MATELAKAYVQIIPSAEGMKGKISEAMGGEADAAGSSFGGKMTGAIKKAIVMAGIGKAISASITEGAELEQSIGGIETMFKDSADKVKQNAANAYKTAGMSANKYMQLTTSFSASLLSSLGNDTSKAADVADMAMQDMSDNANKMGTDMASIQNTYQGFAKQNYTMLDNLKLGYGGTRTEMERLLADAQEISGVEYDINNLSDVYSAVHVIQEELGITGTTAKEAATTLSGSASQMKAAFSNVLGNLSLGEDISGPLLALQGTVHTFIVGNLIPMIVNVLSSLPEVLSGTLSFIVQSLNLVSNNADQIVQQGVELVTNLVSGIVINLPYLLEAAWNLVTALGEALINADWLTITQDLISTIRDGLDVAAGEILGTDGNIVWSVVESIQKKLPDILNQGIGIITNIVNGILQSLPNLIVTAGQMITKFVSEGILPMLPVVLDAGVKLILNIVNGIINNLPQIVSSAAEAVSNFLAEIGRKLPDILQSGIEILGELASGLLQAIPDLVGKIPEIITSMKDAFLDTDWLQIGKDIISGIAKGLSNAGHMIWDTVKGILGSFKDNVLSFFGIHSPSRWGIFVGEMIDAGFAKGILGNLNPIENAVNEMESVATNPFDKGIEYTVNGIGAMSGRDYGTDMLGRFNALLEMLEFILDNNEEIKIVRSDRETIRKLKEMGVVFA